MRTQCPIEALRWRLTNGAPAEGDLVWCRQRQRALAEWPGDLDDRQKAEVEQLKVWLN